LNSWRKEKIEGERKRMRVWNKNLNVVEWILNIVCIYNVTENQLTDNWI
jgi:hypothetical protein